MSKHCMKNLRCEINITPLVDIVLVLLIIFMVITPLLQSAYDVAFPVPGPAIQNIGMIRVQLNDANELYVDGSKIKSDDIAKLVSGHPVMFEATDNVSYGIVMNVIDAIHKANAKQIAIRTRPNI